MQSRLTVRCFLCTIIQFQNVGKMLAICIVSAAAILLLVAEEATCQQDAPYDFAINTRGEHIDELSPSEIAGLSFGVVAVVAGLMVTILFCYYVHKKQREESHASGAFLSDRVRY